jgi:hypothetical protein
MITDFYGTPTAAVKPKMDHMPGKGRGAAGCRDLTLKSLFPNQTV